VVNGCLLYSDAVGLLYGLLHAVGVGADRGVARRRLRPTWSTAGGGFSAVVIGRCPRRGEGGRGKGRC